MHPLVFRGEIELVTTQPALESLLGELRAEGRFGYDSEFIGEHSYYPELCVVQVATSARIALIDPLAGLDLNPFWALLADENVEKIVHAGEPDLEPVARFLNVPPRRIFDTQIVAAFAGMHYPLSLGKLLQEVTGESLLRSSPGMKFSKWNARPLTPAQLHYAADDVRYMPLIHHLLTQRLEATGNTRWALQECQSLSDVELYRFDPHSQRVRVRGIDKLGKRNVNVLRALIAWRDEAAREQNVPPRSMLRDDVLRALAASPARSVADLKKVAGLPRPVEHRYGEAIVERSRSAFEIPIGDVGGADGAANEDRRIDYDALRRRVEALWAIVVQRAAGHAIHPSMVTSKKELERVLRASERGQPIDRFRVMRGWRQELLGSEFHTAIERT